MENLQWRKVTHVVLQGSRRGRGGSGEWIEEAKHTEVRAYRAPRTQRWGGIEVGGCLGDLGLKG